MKAWLENLLGPGIVEVLSTLYWWVVVPILGEPRFGVYFVASTVAVALVFYWAVGRRGAGAGAGAGAGIKGALAYVFPRQVFLHPSALLDYKFFIANQLLMAHLRFGAVVVAAVGLLAMAQNIASGLGALFGARVAMEPGFVVVLAFTLINLLAWDFGKWLAHYLAHKVPVLWEFHKPHHATEVLTPVSSTRAHPIDIMLDLLFRLLCTGVVAGVFAYLYPSGIKELQILGFNAVAMVIYYWIAHLQHSHIPLGYGRYLSRLLVSPHMHQVHHSQEVRHWDRNFGFVFSLWDGLFKTLYVPASDEAFRLGLPEGRGAGQYNSLAALYLRPFAGAWQILVRALRPQNQA